MTRDTENRLIQAIQKQTDKLQYFCSAENTSPNLAVHEIRKSLKRIRALLSFYRQNPSDSYSELIHQLKEKGKELSTTRESFVNFQLFEKEQIGHNLISDKTIKRVKDIFLENNKSEINSLAERKFCKLFNTYVKDFIALLKEEKKGILTTNKIKTELELSYESAYNIYLENNAGFDASRYHDLRKKLKKLWYQFDFVKYQQPKFFKAKSDNLHKITERLGYEHDLFVLQSELQKGKYQFDKNEIQIIEKQIEHIREINRVKLLPRLKQFFSEAPNDFNEKLNSLF